jgi:hypothetical protein
MKSFPISILLLATVLLVPASGAFAAQFRAGETVTIPKEEVLSENAYLAGGEVTVSSAPLKDLVAAGGQLTINGQVWGDALLAGGSVNVLEPIQGDLRVAGGQVKVAHAVRGDLILAGGQVSVLPGSTISGDAVIAGGDVVVDGIINGTTRIYGGVIRINGTISGPLYVRAGESVSFGDKAIIKGQFIYSAPAEAAVTEGAKMPENVQFTQAGPDDETKKGVFVGIAAVAGFFMLVKFLSVLIVSLVIAGAFKKFSVVVASETLARFWFMALIGFLTLIATPVGIIILLATLFGMYFAFIAMALYAVALLGAGVFINITTGALLAKLFVKEIRVNWKWVLLGTVVVFVVAFVPVIGWIAVCLMFLASLGAVAMSMFRDAKAKM